jgi:hypothetical protein
MGRQQGLGCRAVRMRPAAQRRWRCTFGAALVPGSQERGLEMVPEPTDRCRIRSWNSPPVPRWRPRKPSHGGNPVSFGSSAALKTARIKGPGPDFPDVQSLDRARQKNTPYPRSLSQGRGCLSQCLVPVMSSDSYNIDVRLPTRQALSLVLFQRNRWVYDFTGPSPALLTRVCHLDETRVAREGLSEKEACEPKSSGNVLRGPFPFARQEWCPDEEHSASVRPLSRVADLRGLS